MGKLKEKDFEKLNTFYVCADCSNPCIWTPEEWKEQGIGNNSFNCGFYADIITTGISKAALYAEVQSRFDEEEDL